VIQLPFRAAATVVLGFALLCAHPSFGSQAAETLTFAYDDTAAGSAGRGRLSRIADASGSTAYRHDAHGRVASKTQVVGSGAGASTRALATSYQASGRIEGHVLPSGAVVRYGYRADGRVLSISVNGVEIVREIDYHPFGEPKSWGYNSADRYNRSFDRDGRVREHSVGAATRSLTFDAASRITAQSEGAGSPNQWAFGYDNLDRLNSARNSAAAGPVAGVNLAWTYDATGNRLSEARNGAAPIPNTIEATSNRLTQVGSAARSYDAAGNTSTDGNGLASTYSARNRLIQITRGAQIRSYAQNAFGERVCKAASAGPCASSSARTEYVYDDEGRLIGEYPPTVQDGIEVLWLDNTPIAVLKRRPGSSNGTATGGGTATAWNGRAAGGVEVFFIHPDHLEYFWIALGRQSRATRVLHFEGRMAPHDSRADA
jgi:YD repeat-containing protein